MTTLVRICRQLTGIRLLPDRVRLMHHRPRNAEFAKVFGGNVEFGAAADDVTFSNNIRQSPITSADPYLNRLLISYCEEAISYRPRTRGSFRSSVENAVVPLLPHGKARASEIARQLGVSQRTLARRLSEEGLTFSRAFGQSPIRPRKSPSGRPGPWPFRKLHGCLAIKTSAPFRMPSSAGPARRPVRRVLNMQPS